MFIYDFGVDDQFLGFFVQCFSCVFDLTMVEPLTIKYSTDLFDDLAGPFESHYSASYMCEMCLLCKCKVFGNEI